MAEKNINVYRTDESGTIIAKSDGQVITFDKKTSVVKKEESTTKPSKENETTKATEATEAPKATEPPKETEAPTETEAPKETEAPTENPNTDNVREVYITNTGAKYHKGSCSSLKKSKIPISLDKAKLDGYEPCKRCH